MTNIEVTAGTPWEIGAISNARWEGVLLSDVLRGVGLNNSAIRQKESIYDDGDCDQQDYEKAGIGNVQFTGQDDMSASIPTYKAMKRDGDVLLAFLMNGDDIPPEHGYPLRAVVPGHVGVRSVKHLKSIRLREDEAEGPWQRGMAYKGFGPSRKSTKGLDVSKLVSLQEQGVQSAVTVPAPNTFVVKGDIFTFKGYAYSGGGRGILLIHILIFYLLIYLLGIVRVDISIDNGKTWHDATLTEGSEQPLNRAWAWTFWECDLEIPKDVTNLTVISKATDVSHNVQPDTVQGIWNLRGINNNAWHRVNVKVTENQEEN